MAWSSPELRGRRVAFSHTVAATPPTESPIPPLHGHRLIGASPRPAKNKASRVHRLPRHCPTTRTCPLLWIKPTKHPNDIPTNHPSLQSLDWRWKHQSLEPGCRGCASNGVPHARVAWTLVGTTHAFYRLIIKLGGWMNLRRGAKRLSRCQAQCSGRGILAPTGVLSVSDQMSLRMGPRPDKQSQ